jgi:hypothetical protein
MPSSSIEVTAKRTPLWLNLLLSLVVTVLMLLLFEGFSSLLMAARSARHDLYMREESHAQYDPDLGWRHRPGVHIQDQYGSNTPFTTNAAGFRARQEFDRAVPKGRYRLIALGDSFTMGFGVGDDATFPAQMQAACAPLQTLNMGQGGYGVDQDYLWYKRDGVSFDTNVLLVAAIAPDFYRMGNDNFIGYPKPWLKVERSALAVMNVPVPPRWSSRTALRRLGTFVESLATVRLGRTVAFHTVGPAQDQFYGVVTDETLAAAGLAFDDLSALSKARHQQLVLAYLPIQELLPKEPTREAQWMQDYARRAGVPFINLVPEFNRLTPAQLAALFRIDNHYTDEGNRQVATALLRQLGTLVTGFPACPTGAAP